MSRVRALLLSAVVLAVAGVSCGSDSAAEPTTVASAPAPAPVAPAVEGDVTVFAAASLTAAFTEIGDAFTAEYPEANVVFSFAGSSDLVAQITEGAPADVFASADLSNMTKITDAALNASAPVVFATNVAEIIVEAGNPNDIRGVADLADPSDLIIVQCAAEVPCGKYAATIFENAGITVTPASLEENVKGVVTKVTLGEADAGIVYATDVTSAGTQAEGVAIPADINVIAEYPMASLAEASNVGGAQAFIDFVLSDHGQQILASYGFKAP